MAKLLVILTQVSINTLREMLAVLLRLEAMVDEDLSFSCNLQHLLHVAFELRSTPVVLIDHDWQVGGCSQGFACCIEVAAIVSSGNLV
jgi:hypothetical protein